MRLHGESARLLHCSSAVEAALQECEGIACAVVASEGAEGTDKRLVAYVVAELDATIPSAARLRILLADLLPHYAVPSIFCVLDALPVNAASGKTDRKALPHSSDGQHTALARFSVDMDGLGGSSSE